MITKSQYVVLAEVEGHEKPLIALNLTFPRLMDEVIVPYQQDQPFFLDGVPVTKAKLRRIRVLRDNGGLPSELVQLDRMLSLGSLDQKIEIAQNYGSMIEAIARANCADVTAQVIKVFETSVRPRLRDYLPKREEIIEGAFRVLLENLKQLGGGA